MASPAETPQARKRGTLVVVVLLVLFVLWPLTIGPLVWLEHHGVLPAWIDPVAEVVYFPWIRLAQTWEPANDFFWWYLSLWVPVPFRS